MELRSGRRLGSQPPSRAKRRCRTRQDPSHGVGIDHISGLPDDLLLHILACLRCARAAAHTSLVSRRWRGMWRDLSELTFREVAPDALRAALSQVARSELSLLDIDIDDRHRFSPAGVAALLRTAARLAPAELRLIVWGHLKDRFFKVEVPCFHRATSVKLGVWNLYLALPEQGSVFPVLERLSIVGSPFNFGALTSGCPQLRVLEVCDSDGLGTLKVQSPTIEDLKVEGVSLVGIDVVAPVLKRFNLCACTLIDFSSSFSAPIVENLRWSCVFAPSFNGIGQMWGMLSMTLQLEESAYLLSLYIDVLVDGPMKYANLMQMIAPFPDFSVMELYLATLGHAYGAIVFNLLGLRTVIKRLKIIIREFKVRKPCPPNCPCDEPDDWRSQIISLAALEEVEIEGFAGAAYEVHFFKHLFRCAPMLKVITVGLSKKAPPNGRVCKKIHRMFKACPSLKWSFYRSCGRQVFYE